MFSKTCVLTILEKDYSIHLEYWIYDKDNIFKINDNFMSFGIGKRDCIDKSIAMNGLFALFGIMINKCKYVSLDDMNIKQNLVLHQSLIYRLKNLHLCQFL